MTTALEQFKDLMDGEGGGDAVPELSEALVALLDATIEDADRLGIAEVGGLVGVSTDTLRYYEKAGLVTVPRNASGHRLYDKRAIGRVVFITRLRASDMPIRDIERYVRLVDEGPHTVPDRLELLLAHRDEVRRRLSDMRWALAIVDHKIATYGGGACCPPSPDERN